jgi:hypothetical protein
MLLFSSLDGQMWLTFPLDSYTNLTYSPINDIINKNKSMLRVAVVSSGNYNVL